MKKAQNFTVRVGHREPLDPRRSAVAAAAFMHNKTQWVRRRVIKVEEYYIMYVLNGSGTYEDPLNGQIAVNEGDAIITFPGLEHTYGPTTMWDEAYIVLRGPMFTQLETEGVLRRNSPVLSLGNSPALKSSVMSLVEDFLREQRLANPIQTARAHMLVAQMIDTHLAHVAASATQPGADFVRRACALLETDLDRETDLQQVSRRFGFGYERFRKLFADETGVSPARYRILRRIDHAKSLLMEGRVPIKRIAEQLGYCDVYFFARQFKQVTGRTPSEFRRF